MVNYRSSYTGLRWGLYEPHHMPFCTWGDGKGTFSDDALMDYTGLILGWYRYINDILMFCTGEEYTLEHFMATINCNEWNLKFPINYGQLILSFLDINLILNEKERSLLLYIGRRQQVITYFTLQLHIRLNY